MDEYNNDELLGTELDEENCIDNGYFSDLVTWGTDWTVSTLLDLVEKDRVDLNPKMQRRDVWKIEKKSKFIESMLLGIPIPQVILAERKDKKGSFLVIDGKQRLLSLVQFFSKNNDKNDGFKLSNLEVLKTLSGLSHSDIKEDLKLSNFLEILESQTIRTVVIKNWNHEEVLYSIFNRLNTGTEPLSPQELRMSLYPGKFVDYINAKSINQTLQNLVKTISKSAYSRMQDIELITRYYSFVHYIDEYNGRLGKFFDSSVDKLNNSWEKNKTNYENDFARLIEIIDLMHQIFKDQYFKKINNDKAKRTRDGLNKALFDLITYFLNWDPLFEKVKKNDLNRQKFKECLHELFESDQIKREFIAHTTDLEKVKNRFQEFKRIISREFEIDVYLPW